MENLIYFIIHIFTFSYENALFCLAPLAIAGIAAGAGSLLGGIYSSASANSSNRAIAQANNEHQYKMFQEANAFNRQERLETQQYNRKMWYEQQLYNSPMNQAARLSAANINPAQTMNGTAAQTTGQMQGSNPASSAGIPSMSTPTMQPVFNSEMVNQALNSIGDLLIKKEQAKGLQINNETQQQENMTRIQGMIYDNQQKLLNHRLTSDQRESIQQNIRNLKVQELLLQHESDRTSVIDQQNDNIYQQTIQKMVDEHNMASLDIEAKRMANDIQKKFGMRLTQLQVAQLEVGIREANARIGLIGSQKNLTEQQFKHEIEKTAKTVAETTGINQNNKHFNEVKSYIADKLFYEKESSKWTQESQRLGLSRDRYNSGIYNDWNYNRSNDSWFRLFDNNLSYLKQFVPFIPSIK